MKTQKETVHRCEHCNKPYFHKGYCRLHEENCSKNPENKRACFSCIHLEKKEMTHMTYNWVGGEQIQKVKVLVCTKKDLHMLTPKVARGDRGGYELCEVDNQPMPRECSEKNIFSEPEELF